MKQILLFSLAIIVSGMIGQVNAQEQQVKSKGEYTPSELLSSYYNSDFKPFKKSNVFIGMAFSLEDKKLSNVDYLVQQVLDGDKLNYNILLKGGYYIGNYAMAGINFNYYQNKFVGQVFRSPDTLQSNSIT